MEHLTKEIIIEHGFKVIDNKSNDKYTVWSKNDFEIRVFTEGLVFYHNLGFDYPLLNLSALKKLFKEVKSIELKK